MQEPAVTTLLERYEPSELITTIESAMTVFFHGHFFPVLVCGTRAQVCLRHSVTLCIDQHTHTVCLHPYFSGLKM
jgi:hypothetical protein